VETEKIARSHQELAIKMREDLEEQADVQLGKQMDHRRIKQSTLEKLWKQKQAAELHVLKAREKYLNDRTRIESYRKQLRDIQSAGESAGANWNEAARADQQVAIDRIRKGLARTEKTALANEQDLLEFSKALKEMIPAWEASWREFCDDCQDMEEDRVEFLKDNLWTYANEVSTICVNDDNVCYLLVGTICID
jgi:hypothetical protein